MITDNVKKEIVNGLMKKHSKDPNAFFKKGIELGIEETIKQLDLSSVSHQRELFNSFVRWVDYNFDQHEYTVEVKQHIEDYLKTIK